MRDIYKGAIQTLGFLSTKVQARARVQGIKLLYEAPNPTGPIPPLQNQKLRVKDRTIHQSRDQNLLERTQMLKKLKIMKKFCTHIMERDDLRAQLPLILEVIESGWFKRAWFARSSLFRQVHTSSVAEHRCLGRLCPLYSMNYFPALISTPSSIFGPNPPEKMDEKSLKALDGVIRWDKTNLAKQCAQ
jgi:hypothetical protein